MVSYVIAGQMSPTWGGSIDTINLVSLVGRYLSIADPQSRSDILAFVPQPQLTTPDFQTVSLHRAYNTSEALFASLVWTKCA